MTSQWVNALVIHQVLMCLCMWCYVDLLGTNNIEAAQAHMIWECVQDAFNAKVKAMFCQDSEQQVSNEYLFSQ